MGLDLTGEVEPEQLPGRVGDQLRRLLVVEAPVKAHDRVVLDQGVVDRRGRDAAGCETDHHQPALEGYALGRAVVDVAADRVVDHVRARPRGEVLDRLNEVVVLVVDGEVRAQLPAELDLCGRPRCGDHAGAGGFAQLDRGAPDAAGAGMDEQDLTRLQAGSPVKTEVAGLVGQHQR